MIGRASPPRSATAVWVAVVVALSGCPRSASAPTHSVSPGRVQEPADVTTSSPRAAASDCSFRDEYQLAYEVAGMDDVEISCDTVYKQIAGSEATLDLYLPPGTADDDRLPVVIYIHGNEIPELIPIEEHWKRYGYQPGRVLAARGYAVIAFDYRGYSGSNRLAEAYEDVLDLLAYVDANAEDLRADTERLCLFGVSGAGLPATWAAIYGQPRPDCVALLSAGFGSGLPPDVDPVAHLTAGAPPFFVGHGQLDGYANPRRFVQAATAVGVGVTVEQHPGRHGFENVEDPEQQRIVSLALDFIEAHIGQR